MRKEGGRERSNRNARVRCVRVYKIQVQWRSELETVLITNDCTWREEPYDRRCHIRTDKPKISDCERSPKIFLQRKNANYGSCNVIVCGLIGELNKVNRRPGLKVEVR